MPAMRREPNKNFGSRQLFEIIKLSDADIFSIIGKNNF